MTTETIVVGDAAEVEEVAQEAITERVEAEAEVAVAAIDASVEIAQIQADAAVEIAEAEAIEELDSQWLASELSAVRTALDNQSLLLSQVLENQATLAAAMIAPSIQTPPSPPAEEVEAVIVETPPDAVEGPPAVEIEKRRIRRLM